MPKVAAAFHELAAAAGYRLVPEQRLEWLTPRGHLDPSVQKRAPANVLQVLARIFAALEGDERKLASKTRGSVKADFLWLPSRRVVEVDEIQHFTRFRALTLRHYPSSLSLGFDRSLYARWCDELWERAERAYAHVIVPDFPGAHSRARQRAYNDAFRDLCATPFGSGPVIRAAAPERDAAITFKRFAALARSTASGYVQANVIKNYANPVVVVRRTK